MFQISDTHCNSIFFSLHGMYLGFDDKFIKVVLLKIQRRVDDDGAIVSVNAEGIFIKVISCL